MASSIATPARKKRAACVHHWLVSPPSGETSWGECRKCGRRKRFVNGFDGQERTNNSDLFAASPGSWRRAHAIEDETTNDLRLEQALSSLRR